VSKVWIKKVEWLEILPNRKQKVNKMKNWSKYLILINFVGILAGCEHENDGTLPYEQYTDYYVSWQGDIESQGAFFVFEDSTALQAVFHPAAINEKQNWIYAADFSDKLAIGIVKEFNGVCTCPNLDVASIKIVGSTLLFAYTLSGVETNAACDMVCIPNLLVMVDRVPFTTIEFYENGSLVKTIDY
jgi:hypothetical protein